MSFWGKIFGSEKALNEIVESVTEGLDALVYTDEEKASAASHERSEARKMVVTWMESTQGQNLARRLISISITGVWLTMYLISVACSMISVFANSDGILTYEKIMQVGGIAQNAASNMNPAVMLILAFYFAAPHMGDIAKAVTNRFTKETNGK